MNDSVPLPDVLQKFIAASKWTFAKTMPEWPHEYIVRERVDENQFEQLVRHIRANGFEGAFYQETFIYLEEDGLLYWTMGAPISPWCKRVWLGVPQELNYPFRVPVFYECQRCTACCRWPGQVRLTDAEIARLAAFKGVSEHEFIQRFTRLRQDRRGLALQEKPNGECIFLAGENCVVQSVKPHQCRDFPNRWMNSLWGKFPLAQIKQEYPMLANCAGFKAFLKSEGKDKPPDSPP